LGLYVPVMPVTLTKLPDNAVLVMFVLLIAALQLVWPMANQD